MIDLESYKKVFTSKGNNPYTEYGSIGEFILLGVEYPYEGCSIDECKLFKTRDELEKYIDNNPIHQYYVATWINCQ